MKKDIKNWIVIMRCVVIKEVFCTCTEEQAYDNPFDYADCESETDQLDWEVLTVKENA
jgi:hypothetical protein